MLQWFSYGPKTCGGELLALNCQKVSANYRWLVLRDRGGEVFPVFEINRYLFHNLNNSLLKCYCHLNTHSLSSVMIL